MTRSTKILGVITARGGSKGIPKKNIKFVGKKPLIAWTIQAALRCSSLTRTIVSTDDFEIRDISLNEGAEVPFLRPAYLSTDNASSQEVLLHALEWVENQEGMRYDFVLMLQPTSPLRDHKDIDKAVAVAEEKDAQSVVSVSNTGFNANHIQNIGDGGRLIPLFSTSYPVLPRQIISDTYIANGAIYVVKRGILRKLVEEQTWYTDDTFGYVMEEEKSIDIDSEWHLQIVDMMLAKRRC